MGMVTGNIRVNKVTTAMAPEPIIITISNIARSSGTAPASATATSIGGMDIKSVTVTGRRGAIQIDQSTPRGAPMMISAPTMQVVAPIRSQRSGARPSIVHSQTSEAMM